MDSIKHFLLKTKGKFLFHPGVVIDCAHKEFEKAGFSIPKEDISFQNGVVFLRGVPSVVRATIFRQKKNFIHSINTALIDSNKEVVDIR